MFTNLIKLPAPKQQQVFRVNVDVWGQKKKLLNVDILAVIVCF